MKDRRSILKASLGMTAAAMAAQQLIQSPAAQASPTCTCVIKNIQDYCGAVTVGTGAPTEATTLISAIEAASADGVRLYFPKGQYNFDGRGTTALSSINWFGESVENTFILNHPVISVQGFISIETLSFQGGGTGALLYPVGDIDRLHIVSCEFSAMQKVFFYNTQLIGGRVDYALISHNKFTSFNSTQGSVAIINFSTHVVKDITIAHNIVDDIQGSGGSGVSIFYIGALSSIEDNVRVHVTHNKISNVKSVAGNECHAIIVRANHVIISDNIVQDIDNFLNGDTAGLGHGIYVKGKWVIVANNSIHNTNQGQISVKGNSKNNFVVGNSCTGYCRNAACIRMWGEGVISDNYVDVGFCVGGMEYYVIPESDTSASYFEEVVIQSNVLKLSGNSGRGISINGGAKVGIFDNFLFTDSLGVTIGKSADFSRSPVQVDIARNQIEIHDVDRSALFVANSGTDSWPADLSLSGNTVKTRDSLVLWVKNNLSVTNNHISYDAASSGGAGFFTIYIGDGSNAPRVDLNYNNMVAYQGCASGVFLTNNSRDTAFGFIGNIFNGATGVVAPTLIRCLRVETGGYREFVVSNNHFSLQATSFVQNIDTTSGATYGRVVMTGNNVATDYFLNDVPASSAVSGQIAFNILKPGASLLVGGYHYGTTTSTVSLNYNLP